MSRTTASIGNTPTGGLAVPLWRDAESWSFSSSSRLQITSIYLHSSLTKQPASPSRLEQPALYRWSILTKVRQHPGEMLSAQEPWRRITNIYSVFALILQSTDGRIPLCRRTAFPSRFVLLEIQMATDTKSNQRLLSDPQDWTSTHSQTECSRSRTCPRPTQSAASQWAIRLPLHRLNCY